MRTYATPRRFKDLTGKVFGRLSVDRLLGSWDSAVYWSCICTCGNNVEVQGRALNSGNTTSCGCKLIEHVQGQDTLGSLRPMKDAWRRMIQRCTDKSCLEYPRYGGRGITVDPSWHSWEQFLADMGPRPVGMTLERIENHRGYCKENCKWATRREQTRNRDCTLTLAKDGVTRSLAEWSEITGIPYDTLKARKQRLGYSDEICLTKSVKPGEVPNAQLRSD